MEKIKVISKKIALTGLFIITLINWAGNVFLAHFLITIPGIMYFVSAFVCFSLIVQIWFFVDIFYHKNRYNISFTWRDIKVFILIIALGVVVMLMYIFVQEFTDFVDFKEAIYLLESLFYWAGMAILLAIYWFLSSAFFQKIDEVESQINIVKFWK